MADILVILLYPCNISIALFGNFGFGFVDNGHDYGQVAGVGTWISRHNLLFLNFPR